jgi:membrane-associated phospholipid phosphatase
MPDLRERATRPVWSLADVVVVIVAAIAAQLIVSGAHWPSFIISGVTGVTAGVSPSITRRLRRKSARR